MPSKTALYDMIHTQADAIARLADTDLSIPAERLAGARRILLVGTGTSQHAAELGAMMLVHAGIDARWSSAAQFARWGAPLRDGDAVVVITHTAETAFALTCREQALAAGVPVVSVTGIGSGWADAIETVERERSETYTAGYTAALAVLAGIAARLGAEQYGPQALRRTAEAVRAAVADPGIDGIAIPARSLALIGTGPWGVTAREGALKIREASRTLAEGFEAENFLHGSAVPFGTSDGLVLLEPAKDPDGLVAALGEAARAEGITVHVLGHGTDGLPPVLAQLPMTARLQLLADRFAGIRQQNPDVAIVGAWAENQLWTLGAPTA
ncbi:SIS domain-containing protein [Streptomyces sp. NBC_01260]|uniref:SIS domain-containing protein n=1 Tax=unclassified Streptomyces TaxID=2593676 RepID=UPI000F464B6E|nr:MULTISPECIES: SIS domain-containing protein [unclassified Streptomyces]MCX4771896.1 SIS domain-containing protein [Streptomyces sp. NBC_01285]ROQ80748.1 glucosamine--fructose-6-phosphate aminotransferase (isomerizing) [Streptomyces sp. CEV 2-1]RPK49389.1 Glutamine--fructose-6-phosphate aminotransferase [isomerizing] [Streptomyces sp. ADI92-24]